MRQRIADLDASPVNSLRDHINVIDARSGQLISELQDVKQDVKTTRELRKQRMKILRKLSLKQDVNDDIGDLLDLVANITTESEKWHEIRLNMDASRKMVESERKAMHEAKQMLSIEQVMGELNKVLDIVYRFCDRPTIAKIGAAYDREIAGSHIGQA